MESITLKIPFATEKLWPGAPITNSTLLLTLAERAAQEILEESGKKHR